MLSLVVQHRAIQDSMSLGRCPCGQSPPVSRRSTYTPCQTVLHADVPPSPHGKKFGGNDLDGGMLLWGAPNADVPPSTRGACPTSAWNVSEWGGRPCSIYPSLLFYNSSTLWCPTEHFLKFFAFCTNRWQSRCRSRSTFLILLLSMEPTFYRAKNSCLFTNNCNIAHNLTPGRCCNQGIPSDVAYEKHSKFQRRREVWRFLLLYFSELWLICDEI